MNDLGRAFRILLDKWEETPVGSIAIFFTGIIFIAFVVDTMLLYTYPAYTLIAIILLITNVARITKD